MQYEELIPGTLIRRYKRFLADMELEDGSVVTAHCPNSGSMKSVLVEGAPVYCSLVKDPKRKTRYTWEMIRINDQWVGINTSIPNLLVHRWLEEGTVPGFEEYTSFRREVKWGDSRFDVQARGPGGACFIEVKNVTLREGNLGLFPDSVTSRGKKHLDTLVKVREAGMRAVMMYVVQRMDVDAFAPAETIDPAYTGALRHAVEQGVEAIAVQARVTPGTITFERLLPVNL